MTGTLRRALAGAGERRPRLVHLAAQPCPIVIRDERSPVAIERIAHIAHEIVLVVPSARLGELHLDRGEADRDRVPLRGRQCHDSTVERVGGSAVLAARQSREGRVGHQRKRVVPPGHRLRRATEQVAQRSREQCGRERTDRVVGQVVEQVAVAVEHIARQITPGLAGEIPVKRERNGRKCPLQLV